MDNGKARTILQLIAATIIGGLGHFVIANKTLGSLEAATTAITVKATELKIDLNKHEEDVIEHREPTRDKIERIREEFELLSKPLGVQLRDIEDKIDIANAALKDLSSRIE